MGTLFPSGSNVVVGAAVRLTEPACAKAMLVARRRNISTIILLLVIVVTVDFISFSPDD
jgi:hypothetical protein